MFNTLVVEDNSVFREALVQLLSGHFSKMVFEKAESGEEALVKTSRFLPQLIFIDIQLPGQNGLQLSKTLRSKYKNAVIILMTSNDGFEYRQAASRCGADFFLSKSDVSVDEIISVVENVVSGAKSVH